MAGQLHELGIREAGRRIREGTLTSVELTEHYLSRIKSFDPEIHSFVTVSEERALADAERADAAFASGVDRGPMQGIPYGLKDNYDTAGIRTTCHSKLLVDAVPAEDSAVAARMGEKGAVLLGKQATHEFALGGPAFDVPFPPARNPWNTAHNAGGSSSGAGASVAAGFCRVAFGSDTGGSVRVPAAACGVVGLKPTYGLISRRGLYPLSYTLDHCGPLAWSVEDAAIAMEAVAGYDPLDPGSADVAVPDFRARLGHGIAGMRIGVPRHWYMTAPGISAETVAAIDDAAQTLARLGATVEEIRLPDYELFNACGRIIMFSEAYAAHEETLRTRPLDYGALTYMRMALGAFLTSVDLTQAQRRRHELSRAVNLRLKDYDAIMTASSLAPAGGFDTPMAQPPTWPFQTIPFNVTGNPAAALPAGFSSNGLPLSVQIVGRAFDEPTVLQIAAAFEAEMKPHAKRAEPGRAGTA